MKISEHKYNKIIKSIDKLVEFAKGGYVPEKTMGICGNLTCLSKSNCYEVVWQLSPTWEYCNVAMSEGIGNTYPIIENLAQGKWEEDNLAMRLSLLEHIKANLHTFEEEEANQ